MDGAYCGVVFKSTLDKLAAEAGSGTSGGMDIDKLGIRLMRKDDLMPINAATRSLRSPENFQRNFKQIRLSSTVRRIISVAVDSTG